MHCLPHAHILHFLICCSLENSTRPYFYENRFNVIFRADIFLFLFSFSKIFIFQVSANKGI